MTRTQIKRRTFAGSPANATLDSHSDVTRNEVDISEKASMTLDTRHQAPPSDERTRCHQ